jgi:flagellar hook-associated protein 1 FlgK
MTRVLDDPDGIAAASPVTASIGTTNTGTATVVNVTAVSTALNPQLKATFTFTSDTGDYNWELFNTSTNTVASSGSATWTAGESISLNGFELELNGVPRSGDTVVVEKTALPATNNGNARALTELRTAAIVGRQGASGGASITDAYADVLTDIGVRVQGAKISADMSASISDTAAAAVSSGSGVNLDEEAARLIQFQQSYQAAAKMLQVAQSIFDTLLQTAAG